jgi:ppGpp synthetase/RelA/SpoT-type nucleotidyltranferase
VASRAQIDKLGERLKAGPVTEADLRLLDSYRLSFAPAYVAIVGVLVEQGLHPSGREAKSRGAIVDKLRRESIRLTQIQDIAGCRVVVIDRLEQDAIVSRLLDVMEDCEVVDRRATPSHGYRAVHVVARQGTLPVEVQIRTAWQHHWAETSEKLSDEVGLAFKYGGGPQDLQLLMKQWSDAIAEWESWLASRVPGKTTLVEQTQAEREHQRVLVGRHRALEILAAIRRRDN